MKNSILAVALSAALAVVGGCATTAHPGDSTMDASNFGPVSVSVHRGDDDLLTGGLGLAGLRAMVPPAFANPEAPTAAEVRRRAIWSNWRGIADLAPGGGYGDLYGSLAASPGREFQTLARLPGANQPHRVLVQVPDNFDQQARCIVLAPASGSRGVLGAIAVAGPWALPKGCAVAYTDKGAGSDYFDLDAGLGIKLDGTVGGTVDTLAFQPEPARGTGVASKHAHSRDNPEAHWGEHVRQSAVFALRVLNEAFPDATPFAFDNTRVIAVGISNGGGAVLQAAQAGAGGEWLDAVVAGEPNVTVEGARPIYDYTTEAALLMPCALPVLGIPPMPTAAAHCAALAEAGLVEGDTLVEQQQSAYRALRASGWTDQALRAGSISVAFDLWRAVAVTYASAYGRYPVDAHPCGYTFSAVTAEGTRRPATATERAAWASEASGIAPGSGVSIIPSVSDPARPLAELQCLRGLWDGQGADPDQVRQGIRAVQVAAPDKRVPVMVIHGLDDGLIPPAFSSEPYVAAARAAGSNVHHWQVANVQHFDAFLGLPVYAGMYLPLLPYVYEALDRTWAHLESGAPMPADAVIATTPRGMGAPLEARHLAIPR